MRLVLIPQPLRPGDRIRIVAPSGPFDRALAWRALGWLRERYRVEFEPGLFSRSGMFAGTDQRRLAELNAALRAPDAAAVLAARGGHGLLRIAPHADLAALARAPKWVVGFSDITFLHNEIARLGLASVHGPNLTGLGRGCARTRARLIELLEMPLRRRCYGGLQTWVPGAAHGRLAGGNLTVLFTCAAAGRLELPPGCLLLLEEVSELAYRLDRMLTALLVSGALRQVAGIIVGDLVDCPPAPSGVTAEQVLRERLCGLGVPVVAGMPFGHGRYNEPLPLGIYAELDASAGSLAVGADE